MKSVYIDNCGQKFGRLLVIERVENRYTKKGKIKVRYKCLCDCGKVLDIAKTHLIQGRTKSCGCLKSELTSKRSWKGYEEISGQAISHIKCGAKIRGFEYSVSNEFLWELFLKQDRKCILTGQDIAFIKDYKSKTISQTASLDRIDSSKGYTEDNVWWVHKDINRLKFDFSLDKFYKLCEDVVNYKNLTK